VNWDGEQPGRACAACLRRAWLLSALAGHLDLARADLDPVLALSDEQLLAAVGGRRRESLEAGLARFDASAAHGRVRGAGLRAVCRCQAGYPPQLQALASPPAVLHATAPSARLAELLDGGAVAIVGSRKGSPYGLQVAHLLARSLALAGIAVISGMALGIDSAAHEGALAAAGSTVAVLAGAAERAYPRSARSLHRKIAATGAAVSELPPGTAVRRWMFPARNRVIAGLAAMTVVVEATAQSGALLTASYARELGRPVGAVPGRITSPLATGPHGLIDAGATIVRGPEDVLEALFGAGDRPAIPDLRPGLEPEQAALLEAIAAGHDTRGALALAGVAPERGLAALASLEVAGYVRREPGGRYAVVP
jgi:DNA processing protein